MEGRVSVKYLTVDYLSKITRGEKPQKVRVLHLEGKQDVFGDSEKLRQLEHLQEFVNLEELYLAHNALVKGVVNELSKLSKLRVLDLSYNGLEDESMIANYSRFKDSMRFNHLETLHLSHNQLTSIPAWIPTCPRLREFQMSFNHWSMLEDIDTLGDLKQLGYVDLRGNSIEMRLGTREFLYVIYKLKFIRLLNGEEVSDPLRKEAKELFYSEELEMLNQKISDLMCQRNTSNDKVSELERTHFKLNQDYQFIQHHNRQLEHHQEALEFQVESLQSLVERQAKQLMNHAMETLQISEESLNSDRFTEKDASHVLRRSDDLNSRANVLIAPQSNFLREHAELYEKYHLLEAEHARLSSDYLGHLSEETNFKETLKQKLVSVFEGVKDYRGISILEAKDASNLEFDDVLQLLRSAFIQCNNSFNREIHLVRNEESLDLHRLKIQQEKLTRYSCDLERSHKDNETVFKRQIRALKDMIDVKDRVIHAMQSTRLTTSSKNPDMDTNTSESLDLASTQLKEIDIILTKCLGKNRRAASLNVVDAFKVYLQLLRQKIHPSISRTISSASAPHDDSLNTLCSHEG